MCDREQVVSPHGGLNMPSESMRLWQLERLVLLMTKMAPLPADGITPSSAELAAIVAELRQRHPDV